MNKLYLISFKTDSNSRRLKIIKRIKDYVYWARITPESWCIKCPNTTVAIIRDYIKTEMKSEDKLFVVEITNSAWASYNITQEVADWLKE